MGIFINAHLRFVLWTVCFLWYVLGATASTYECFKSVGQFPFPEHKYDDTTNLPIATRYLRSNLAHHPL